MRDFSLVHVRACGGVTGGLQGLLCVLPGAPLSLRLDVSLCNLSLALVGRIAHVVHAGLRQPATEASVLRQLISALLPVLPCLKGESHGSALLRAFCRRIRRARSHPKVLLLRGTEGSAGAWRCLSVLPWLAGSALLVRPRLVPTSCLNA